MTQQVAYSLLPGLRPRSVKGWRVLITVNVEIFALYIFSCNSHFLNLCENICTP